MTRVGLLGEGAEAAADAVSDAGGEAVVGETGDVDVVAALDEAALLDAAAGDVDAAAGNLDTPLLPVGAGREYGGVSDADRVSGLAALGRGEFSVVERPTLAVSTGDGEARALADVTLVTRDPAKISEFGVRRGGREVESVRADGVVVATPTGSRGYAADAGGPVLDADVDAVSVVPVAPFRVDRTNRVVAPPLSVAVVRDETAVELHVDGRDRGLLAAHDPVELAWGASLSVAVVSGSRAARGD